MIMGSSSRSQLGDKPSSSKLEAHNEKSSGLVQMVKLVEKERESLEGVKNETEAYMLKELSMLKWQEKATKLSSENNSTELEKLWEIVLSLEDNVKIEREKIKENTKTLKELEDLHVKYMKKQEELDSGLRHCKDEFKEFERHDLKYREDFKHLKKKIKKKLMISWTRILPKLLILLKSVRSLRI